MSNINEMLGRTLVNVEVRDDEVIFVLDDGSKRRLYHSQDCCESVTVEDVVGDIKDLIGSPLTMCEEMTNSESHPEDKPNPAGGDGSFTWTFYRFATVKGYVTIRWFGTSNGYYSESVTFQ